MRKDKEYVFSLDMKVRDYECDLQGVVNNANYLHYLEHTRHEYLHSLGTDFTKLHDQGLDAIVTKVSLVYRRPLRSEDEFSSRLYWRRLGVRYVFYQDIYLKQGGNLVLEGIVETVCVCAGQIVRDDVLSKLLS